MTSAALGEGDGAQGKTHPLRTVLLDLGPLVVFFAVNALAPGDDVDQAVWATGAFMVAMTAAMIYTYWKDRKVTPMQLITLVLVGVFGGLTIYLHDEAFIQMKPTISYLLFAGILFGGLFTGRPLLKLVLAAGMPPLSDRGWRKMTLNWALFFTAMAVANELARAYLTFDQWVNFKVWGLTILGFVFALTQVPLLNRYARQKKTEER
ncbi:septation protein IspZ [Pacificimonas flava]|uniref:Inner membrane-spanning protein YciB n=3 Tax=Sphingosinicellaceae TaxID=2820280 RepID=A0A219B866_9SPHN|nr:septation protein IspZ [Pacificimonas aurantium]OWV34547.1 septation protein IspZ [Pacificimonas flava]